MRHQLVGYLLDALDQDDRAAVEAELQTNTQLQHELELLSESFEPLRAGEGTFQPPSDLAQRTCERVEAVAQGKRTSHRSAVLVGGDGEQDAVAASPAPVALASGAAWSGLDLTVLAGICLAAGMLIFPALLESRETARRLGCMEKLLAVGNALHDYANRNDGWFPRIASTGPLSSAGMQAVVLRHDQFVSSDDVFVCPASNLANCSEGFRVPTLEELHQASPAAQAIWKRRMGGSVGFNLGREEAGKYRPLRDQRRPYVALVADAPSPEFGFARSGNHGGEGQNVFFEDGHIQFLTGCHAEGCDDDIYHNDRGEIAAGLHVRDVAIGASGATPVRAWILMPAAPIGPAPPQPIQLR